MFSNNISDYEFISIIQNGKFGTVYKGSYINQKQLIVIKKISLEQKDDKLNKLCDELFNCRQFKHTNINKVLHSFIYGNDVYILYPFICYGNCEMLLQNIFTSGFPETLIALIFKDILSALVYIHSHDFVHGAVRAKSILLDGKKAVLSNFQECRSFISQGQRKTVLFGVSPGVQKNLNWTAPEVLDQNLFGHTEKSDVYSVGITACEMANGFQPYLEMQPTLMYTEKIRGNFPSLLDKSTLLDGQGTIPFLNCKISRPHEIYRQRILSDDFHQLVEICLNRNPSSRWSIKKLMTHSFFKQCRHSCITDQLMSVNANFENYLEIEDNPLGKTDVYVKGYENIQWNFEF